ncbi:protein MMS22-like [Anopheles stephensi]|uniref:protein MMS22-like n=1 Tax=Anopheles stephensi TaxID=30069 RepID=UPI0016588BE4|nr:protein MMS22-like [Anopheles stephensi]XP_035912477.1 protein MMS22-like [Anopheles stephensi]
MMSSQNTVFDCRSPNADQSYGLRIFARNGGISFGLPFEMDKTTDIFGIEVRQWYDQLVNYLSQMARERIQKLQLYETLETGNHIRVQRREITRFLRLVLGNATCMEGQVISESISMVLGALPDLMDPLLKNGWNSLCDKESCGYQIFHGVLEWRWLLMLILKDVKECTMTTNDEFLIDMFEKRTVTTFGKIYGEMMADMLKLSYHLFQMYGVDNIIVKTPYTCFCTKLMWLGMMVLADTTKKVDFWICLNDNMPATAKGRSDGYLFQIWLMNALTKFYEHGPTLENDKASETLLSGYTAADDIAKKFLKSDVKEIQVRQFLLLLDPIISVLWPERFETVIAVWDYFSVRLNSCFVALCDPVKVMSSASHSVAGFIEQATLLVAPETKENHLNLQKNSFHLFLIMLSKIIRHCTAQALNRKVQIIFNRIYLKLGPTKFENMTEQAIHNLGLLFLTMTSATSFENDYPRMSQLIQNIPLSGPANFPVDARINRILVATQVHMALLVLFTGSSFDKSAHIASFLGSIDIQYKKYGDRMQPALKIIVEGMDLIYNKAILKKSFNRGEKHFIKPWMLKYLRYRSSEREKQKLLQVIVASLNCNDESLDDEYCSAIDQYVMPFVKEKFTNKASPPCIAQIAARLTILKSASDTSTVVHMPSFFTTYINCPTACPEQVLVYLKELIQSSKMLSIIGDKVIIQQWLKLGFYFDRESMLELTRVVYGLKEFKAICDIPTYDMFESKENLIKLFFVFVAKRYKESDTATQLEMKSKLHGIFQNFDGWISNPEGIIRRRILAGLVSALKECPEVFYIESDYSCLYNIAFNHFFLPVSMLVYSKIEQDCIEAIASIWHDVMAIIGKMDYRGDVAIQDTTYNMIDKWIPYFAKLTNPNDAVKPMLLFFCSRNEELLLYTMPRFVKMFVDLERCLPKPNALPVMQMLKRLIKTLVHRKNYETIALFIRLMGTSITQHAYMCNELYSTRSIALEIVFELIDSTEGPSDLVKQAMGNVFLSFTLKCFPFSDKCYINFACRLFDYNPNFIRSMIDLIRCDVGEVEISCGQQNDNILQKALERLEHAFKENNT